MAEYLSPGVYIEALETGVKPIAGVSTSTVGFVGVSGLIQVLPKEDKLPTNNDITTSLDNLKAKLAEAILEERAKNNSDLINAVNEMPLLVETIEKEIKQIRNPVKKLAAQKDLKSIKNIVAKAKEVALYVTYADKPTFISGWSDFVSKFGIYIEDSYLAPSVYSFFVNGGKRCYVVSVKDENKASIIGTNDELKGRTGLTSLEEIDEVSIVCIPGVTDGDIQLAMITHCEKMEDRFCIFDSIKGATLNKVITQKNNLISDRGIGAFYYPWIKTAIEKKDTVGNIILDNMLIPPSGAMAGIYARSDAERGVHKAPANEVLRRVTELERSITKAEQDILNPLNINCIRAFQGHGIRVWGARTIAPKGSEWKYINVRRLFLFLEESIYRSTQWVVFEPNNEVLWARVRESINNFLFGIWRNGALMGRSPKEAFFVKCDRSTMTYSDIDAGKLIVVIGLAPIRPAEFVILKITQFTANANS